VPVTFYSDQFCTDNQVEDNFGECGSLLQSEDSRSAGILSFSIDSCESPDSSHQASPVAPNTTTLVEASPTSMNIDSGDGDKLAIGSEIASILGGICGVIAIVISIVFGMNRWKKRHEFVPQWLKSLMKCVQRRCQGTHRWIC
jgi:hypothetical protein